ncbi:MAG TPA: efflux RND transporter periplasmic adaptor subunit [bacterium]|nr:efflux RND transporter periplasmic adaptor subunit [bacterium]
MRRWTVIAGAVVLTIVIFGAWAIDRWGRPAAPAGTIEASGRIEGDDVSVGSKIGGRIERLVVAEGDRVVQGQLIAVLSAPDLAAAVRQAEAQVATAGAQVMQARSAVSVLVVQLGQAQTAIALVDAQVRAQEQQAQAALAAALASETQARRDLARAESLERAGAIARADVETAGTRLQSASALVDAARGQVAMARAGTLDVARLEQQRDTVERQLDVGRKALAAAQSQYEAAAAARDVQRVTFGETRVYAPLSGVVVTKVANLGEVVQAGSPIAVLVDLRALWLKVYIPEPQIGKIRLGDQARVYVDAFPGRPFAAQVSEINDQAEFTPKDVQTREERVKLVFAVKLAVDNADRLLKPGMPADGTIVLSGAPGL